MNKQQFAPFYVGQEVECVENTATLKKGNKYTITDIVRSSCKCASWAVCVGIKSEFATSVCNRCNKSAFNIKPYYKYHNQTFFRAITPAMEAVNFEKITEQHPVSVN